MEERLLRLPVQEDEDLYVISFLIQIPQFTDPQKQKQFAKRNDLSQESVTYVL